MLGFFSKKKKKKKKGVNASEQTPTSSVALFIDSSRLDNLPLNDRESYQQYIQTKGYSAKDGESDGIRGIILRTPTSAETLLARDELREILGSRSAVKLIAPHPGHEIPPAPEF